jgi:aryl-alcohol dehydrogenase-like predicted oxidoreductase
MEYRELGRTGVKVSALCLGTMTFGQQNSEAEGHEQMDYAVDCGINIFDAAELYPIPPKPDTQGRTEEIIGTWLASRRARPKVMVATKAIGRTKMDWLRTGRIRGRQEPRAAHRGARRQPEAAQDRFRPMRIVEGLDYVHLEGDTYPIEDILGVLGAFVQQGKVRFIGLSNETPWGDDLPQSVRDPWPAADRLDPERL